MTSQPDVIGIGHITCDIICPLESWPERDTKTILPGLTLAGGGPAANTSAALAKLGVKTALVGKLGDDLFGSYTLEQHQRAGIDCSHIEVDPATVSPVSVILSDLSENTRTILLTKGDKTTYDPTDIDWDWIRSAKVIHLDGHQMPASLEIAARAREWPDTKVILDAGSMREGMVELCGLCDIVIASARFSSQLCGSTDPKCCIEQLIALGAGEAGTTLGADGSWFYDGADVFHQAAYHVKTLDTTGAGDAFHGGFIYALLAGMDSRQCIRHASAVGAIKCTGLGAREPLPDVEKLYQFLASQE